MLKDTGVLHFRAPVCRVSKRPGYSSFRNAFPKIFADHASGLQDIDYVGLTQSGRLVIKLPKLFVEEVSARGRAGGPVAASVLPPPCTPHPLAGGQGLRGRLWTLALTSSAL